MVVEVDSRERSLALLSWAGLVLGGPVAPLIVLLVSRSSSLAREESVKALRMWAVVLAIWLPTLAVGVLSRPEDPSAWVYAVAATLLLLVAVISAVSFVRVWRLG